MSNNAVKWSLAGIIFKVSLPVALWLAGQALAMQLDDRPVIQSGSPDVLGAAVASLAGVMRLSSALWLFVNVLVLRKKPHEMVPNWMKQPT